jgi:hypothetical protein
MFFIMLVEGGSGIIDFSDKFPVDPALAGPTEEVGVNSRSLSRSRIYQKFDLLLNRYEHALNSVLSPPDKVTLRVN